MIAQYIFVLFLAFGATLSASAEERPDQKSLEENLTRELSDSVERILPKRDFTVFVSVQSHQEEKRLQVGDQVEVEDIEIKESEPVPPMPGFDPPRKMEETSEPQKKRSAQTYAIKEVTVYDAVKVILILDSSVSDETAGLLKTILTEKIEGRFQVQPSIKIERRDGINPDLRTKVEAEDFFQTYLRSDGARILTLIVAFMLGLVALILLFSLIRGLLKNVQLNRSNRSSKPIGGGHTQDSSQPARGPEASGVAVEASQKAMGQLFQFLHEEPQLGRSFFMSLNKTQASALYHGISTQSNRTLLARQLSFSEDELQEAGKDADQKAVAQTLLDLAQEIEYFKRIHSAQQKARFGFLALLTGKEVLALIPAMRMSRYLAIMLPHLNGNQLNELLQNLTEDQKLALFAAQDKQEITHLEVVACEEELRSRYEAKAHDTKVDERLHINHLLDHLLEHDMNAAQTISQLEKRGINLPQNVQVYRTRVTDILAMSDEILLKLLPQLDNEDIASLIASYPESQGRLMTGLPDLRQKLIQAAVDSLSPAAKDKERAEMKLLKVYRQKAAKS